SPRQGPHAARPPSRHELNHALNAARTRGWPKQTTGERRVTSRPMSSPPIDADAPTDTLPDPDTRSRELLAPAGTQEVHENGPREPVGGRVLWGMDERTWRRIRFVLIGLYGAAYVWWFIERGII